MCLSEERIQRFIVLLNDACLMDLFLDMRGLVMYSLIHCDCFAVNGNILLNA